MLGCKCVDIDVLLYICISMYIVAALYVWIVWLNACVCVSFNTERYVSRAGKNATLLKLFSVIGNINLNASCVFK